MPVKNIFIIKVIFISIISCTQVSNKSKETRALRFSWESSTTLKYNYTSSTFNYLNICVEIENPTDSFYYISKDYGDIVVDKRRNNKVKFSHTLFNPRIVYPKSKEWVDFGLAYLRIENPNEEDFDFQFSYIVKDTIFNKKDFHAKLSKYMKTLVDTSRVYLPVNTKLIKSDEYKLVIKDDSPAHTGG